MDQGACPLLKYVTILNDLLGLEHFAVHRLAAELFADRQR